jgi:hypothetical protein
MGWTSLALFPVLTGAAIFVLVDHRAFPAAATTAASVAVLTQAIGLIIAVWRLVLGKGPSQLTPVIPDAAEVQRSFSGPTFCSQIVAPKESASDASDDLAG